MLDDLPACTALRLPQEGIEHLAIYSRSEDGWDLKLIMEDKKQVGQIINAINRNTRDPSIFLPDYLLAVKYYGGRVKEVLIRGKRVKYRR